MKHQPQVDIIKYPKSYAQSFDQPLHNAKVVHHLHEGNEEDDRRELMKELVYASADEIQNRTYCVDEEPMLGGYDVSIEEESGTLQSLGQEIGSEDGNPREDLETGA